MQLIVKLEVIDGSQVVERKEIWRSEDVGALISPGHFGPFLAKGKAICAGIQRAVVKHQVACLAATELFCRQYRAPRWMKDHRRRVIDTVYSQIDVYVPRRFCVACGSKRAAFMLPISGRSSTEYERVRAKLAAHLPDRAVGDVLSAYLPVTGGASHPTVRRHTHVVAHWLEADAEPIETLPNPVPAVMTVALDTGYVREPVHVHLAKGEQRQGGSLALNPQGLLPLLEDGKARISHSLAIIRVSRADPPRAAAPAWGSRRSGARARWPWSAPARCTGSTPSAC